MQICIYYLAKDNLAHLSEKKTDWWGRPLLPEILGQPSPPVGAKSPIFDLFSLVASQPYDLAKKSSINTNMKYTVRFPMRFLR